MCTGGFVKRQGRDADYSPQYNAKVKNYGFIPPLPPPFLHGIVLNYMIKYRDNKRKKVWEELNGPVG
jgi:hypothetical protein